MTVIAAAKRLAALGASSLRFELLALVLLVAIGAVTLALGSTSTAGPARRANAQPLAPAQAAVLVEATSGEAAAVVRAVGDDAVLINASLPFSSAAVQPAAAFTTEHNATLDRSRALLCLTQAVYYEAGFEPLAGRRAVAQVVINRMRHPAFPKSICQVVYQRNSTPVCQFSFVCDGSLLRAPAAAAWRIAEDVARAALDGHVEAAVGAATHYHADYVAPRWAPLLAKITKLGAHIFYRWPGGWGQSAMFTGRYIGEPHDPASLRPRLLPAVIRRADGTIATVVHGVDSGPPIARAPNDVGGLLDTSKGWTLNIPGPGEAEQSARSALAQQSRAAQPSAAAAPVAGAATAAPQLAKVAATTGAPKSAIGGSVIVASEAAIAAPPLLLAVN